MVVGVWGAQGRYDIQRRAVRLGQRQTVGIEPQDEIGSGVYGLDHRFGMTVAPVGDAHLPRSQGKVPQAFARPHLGNEQMGKFQGDQVEADVQPIVGPRGPGALDGAAIDDHKLAVLRQRHLPGWPSILAQRFDPRATGRQALGDGRIRDAIDEQGHRAGDLTEGLIDPTIHQDSAVIGVASGSCGRG
jgi:hypothetical protein